MDTMQGTNEQAASFTWSAIKRPSGTCYDVASENGIRCTPWPIAKLCHARVLAGLVNGTPDNAGDCDPAHKLAILRVMAISKAFYRWEATDRSRNYPEAAASWNAYVPTIQVVENNGRLEAIRTDERMLGWTPLPGIVPTIKE